MVSDHGKSYDRASENNSLDLVTTENTKQAEMINSAAKQLNDMQDKIFLELESQGVDLSKYLKTK